VPKGSVVVTGASTGIGRATVHELVSAGFHVFGSVRREADAGNLRQQFPETVTPLLMDLLDEDSARAAGEVVKAAGPLFGLSITQARHFPARSRPSRLRCSDARSRSI
jgi:NAD(P)-dependent dehydrogenase (short-subunit alcohol dehydrogenase family)